MCASAQGELPKLDWAPTPPPLAATFKTPLKVAQKMARSAVKPLWGFRMEIRRNFTVWFGVRGLGA